MKLLDERKFCLGGRRVFASTTGTWRFLLEKEWRL
jgi:hypothetical protein